MRKIVDTQVLFAKDLGIYRYRKYENGKKTYEISQDDFMKWFGIALKLAGDPKRSKSKKANLHINDQKYVTYGVMSEAYWL